LCLACNAPAEIDPTLGGENPSGINFGEPSTSLPTTSDGDGPWGTSTTGDGDGSADASSGGPTCGNGILEDGELCDDGNADDSDACTTSCVPAKCGDGVLQVPEECDEGVDNGPGMACTIVCKINVCGDGDRGPDEPCDDGNMDDTDACTSLCQVAACGDGFVQAGVETCDTQGNSETCDGDCTQAECGDGFTNPAAGEECDDGDDSSLDNCYPTCTAPTMRTIAETGESIDELDPMKDEWLSYIVFWSSEAEGFVDSPYGSCADWTTSSYEHMGHTTGTIYQFGGGYGDSYSAHSCNHHLPLLCVQQAWYPDDPKPL